MKIAAILLAAGKASRFRGKNKLLVNIKGVPVIARSAGALSRVTPALRPMIIVTGHEQERVRDALDRMLGETNDMTFVHNPNYASGMASSLHAGLGALPNNVDGVVIALADMPLVESRHVEKLLEAFEGRASICVPMVGERRGNPTLWGSSFFRLMYSCEGDIGAKGLLIKHAEQVRKVAFDDAATLTDIDTPEEASVFF